eukprot:gene19974-25943_t
MLGGYLIGTWMFGLMPASYYSFSGEHRLDPRLYKASHKPHHRFTNPRIVPANVWSYMAFGSLYANWLTLIHSEYSHPWDSLFRKIGFGTAADHHVHHKLFVYNFGHLFMYWDKLFGTYKSPSEVALFNKDI